MGQKKGGSGGEKDVLFYRWLLDLAVEARRLMGEVLWELDTRVSKADKEKLQELTKHIMSTFKMLFEESLDLWAEANPNSVDQVGEVLGLPSEGEQKETKFYFSNN